MVAKSAVETALFLIETTAPAKLFGADPQKAYRDLAKLIHPDRVELRLNKRAKDAFAKLSQMYAALNGKAAAHAEQIVGKWIVGAPLAKGDLADLYHARSVTDETRVGVLKLARSPKDSDLMEQEYVSLGILHKHTGGDNFKRYLPKALDRFDASRRRANVLTVAVGARSLADIIALRPNLDFRHVVWMVNRTLNVLGFAHECGIVHGAVLPEHLLFGPADHSLVLVDWCYSVSAESRKHIPAIVKAHANLYPVEVARRVAAHPAVDIYMLFATIKATGVAIPKRFKSIFDWALAASPRSRPIDAWELQARWADLAKEEFGPPQFIQLDIPIS